LRLVVGLGNPGKQYEATRHNIGFMVVDGLATRWRVDAWKGKFGAEIAQTQRGETQVVLAKPQEFMNVSGMATQRVAQFFKIEPKDIIVVHDELDLAFGTLRVKVGGGHGGHNGLRSISEQCGPAFMRVRCGVGKPDDKERTVGHVLGGFNKAEEKELPFLVGNACDAIELILDKGPIPAMNKFNAGPKQ
jgi:PTH1 family peptidyl-tRNA hydrolase